MAIPAAVYWPLLTALAAVLIGLTGLVAMRPHWATYIYLAVAPLILGIDRGTALPFLRPNELLLGVLWLGVLAGPVTTWMRAGAPTPRVVGLDGAVLAVAVTSSVTPMAWAYSQGEPVGLDDLLYGLALWKFLVLYLLVRITVRTARQARRAIVIMLAAAVAVAVVGVLQSLQLFGVPSLLTAYAPLEEVERLTINRASSTIGTPIGFADVMVISLSLAVGWLAHIRAYRIAVAAAATVTGMAALASGQASGLVGLLVAGIAAGWAVRRLWRVVLITVPVASATAVVLWPVIAERLERLDPRTGLPASWTGPYGRWANLTSHVWPRIGEDGNWLFGVQMSSRIPAPEPWRQWIYIESGYTWLVWNGGLPLLASFIMLAVLAFRAGRSLTRGARGVDAVVGVGAFTAMSVYAVLMLLDPHLSMRGGADLVFPLLALTANGRIAQRDGTFRRTAGRHAREASS